MEKEIQKIVGQYRADLGTAALKCQTDLYKIGLVPGLMVDYENQRFFIVSVDVFHGNIRVRGASVLQDGEQSKTVKPLDIMKIKVCDNAKRR